MEMLPESIVIQQVKIRSCYCDTFILWVSKTVTKMLMYWIIRHRAIILLPLKHLRM